MIKYLSSAILIFALIFSVSAQTFSYDFSNGYEGWTGDFADYPAIDSVFYELEFTRLKLPLPLDTNIYSLMITGDNHSDDLFMFIKRKITGLLPNTTYLLQFDVEFASIAPTNAIGVGGPPGEAVTMKAGASLVEPTKIDSNGFYFMNIDKGNQVMGGADMKSIGHVGVSDTTTVFTLISRNNSDQLFSITTNNEGEIWVCIGTDSGFEATTTIFYNEINLTFTNVLAIQDVSENWISVVPNPCNDFIYLKTNPDLINKSYRIFDQVGKLVLNGKINLNEIEIDITELSAGIYILKIEDYRNISMKIIKL
jgi:hypothetical protein